MTGIFGFVSLMFLTLPSTFFFHLILSSVSPVLNLSAPFVSYPGVAFCFLSLLVFNSLFFVSLCRIIVAVSFFWLSVMEFSFFLSLLLCLLGCS